MADKPKTKITVSTGQYGARISSTMWGIFFEDINFGGDGGLYPELVKNRSFEFPDHMMGWIRRLEPGSAGYMYIEKYPGNPTNAHYLHMDIQNIGDGFGISNEGFRGMGIREGAEYRFSLQARQLEGEGITLRIEIIAEDGRKLMETKINGFEKQWKKHAIILKATSSGAKARMNLFIESGNGILDLDVISLFPTDTYKNRENGLRADLVKMLAELKPGFLRFPGGCIVEGRTLAERYQWKTTVGDPIDRKLIVNRWNTEFNHRITQDYYQSFGLGFYEYFLLCEDIRAEPMPILNCGMACQFNTGELVTTEELEPYIQDMLDLIEFANGTMNCKWGKLRAEMGHPEPFNMKYLGIGNEQWGPQYIQRYIPIAKVLKEKHPEIQLIAGTGSDATIFPNGQAEINYLWEHYRQMDNIDIVDEHFYRTPDWFLENVDFYDGYDRSGPKIFVGEWGAQSVGVASPDNRNNWQCALYEAVFMTGLERNADIVIMTCYAPLFGHLDAWQWTPDMIWFDNLGVYGTPNYYVQKLFSLNPGTHQLTAIIEDSPVLDDKKQGLHASATIDENADEVILKVVNVTDEVIKSSIDLLNVKKSSKPVKIILLTSDSLIDENSLNEPKKIYPQETTVKLDSPNFTYEFPPISLTILRIPVK
ncbi:alpha-L-arabinofuranosidase [candidate division KSB1 bacterium]|nr:alpha-L-arabinofuranosidase [candidate division KSB1 bacterium]